MSLNQTLIERTGYTVLDILSDVGGLQGILVSVIFLFLSVLNHNDLDNYLVSKLFKSETVSMAASQTESIKEFCRSKVLPNRLVCCAKRRK